MLPFQVPYSGLKLGTYDAERGISRAFPQTNGTFLEYPEAGTGLVTAADTFTASDITSVNGYLAPDANSQPGILFNPKNHDFGTHQFSESVIYANATSTNMWNGPCVFAGGDTAAGTADAKNMYIFIAISNTSYRLYRRTGFTGFGSLVTYTSQPTNYLQRVKLRLEAKYTGPSVEIDMYLNGVHLGTYSDTAANRITPFSTTSYWPSHRTTAGHDWGHGGSSITDARCYSMRAGAMPEQGWEDFWIPTEVAAVGGFNPGWAINSNVVLQ